MKEQRKFAKRKSSKMYAIEKNVRWLYKAL